MPIAIALPVAPPAQAPTSEPEISQPLVDAVARQMREHCAPTTWDRAVKSLRANGFPFTVN